jgi:hypothetical protein
MPSKSEKQRKFFGAVAGAKKGDSKVSGAAKKTAKKMPMKEIKKFLKKDNEEDAESIAKKVAKKGKAKFTKKAPTPRKKTAPASQVQKTKKGKGSYARNKDKTTVEESAISSFIDCVLEKNYDDASKYLTSILNSKLQARIENELATPLF